MWGDKSSNCGGKLELCNINISTFFLPKHNTDLTPHVKMWVDNNNGLWGLNRIELMYSYILILYPTLQGPYIPLSRNLSKMWGQKNISCGFCYSPTSKMLAYRSPKLLAGIYQKPHEKLL